MEERHYLSVATSNQLVSRYIQAVATTETKLLSRKNFLREDKMKVFQLASILIHDAVLVRHLSENLLLKGTKMLIHCILPWINTSDDEQRSSSKGYANRRTGRTGMRQKWAILLDSVSLAQAHNCQVDLTHALRHTSFLAY
jgi:hypothetical protein